MDKKRVLFVDDDPDIISAYQRTLRRKFQIKTVQSANEAIELIEEGEKFAVIVTDYRMPKINGVELLEYVKKASPQTMRVLITGYADLQTSIDAVNRGSVFRFLTKPIPTSALINAIKDAMDIYEIKESEKVILEKTLKGSVKLLLDMITSVRPQILNRSGETRKLCRKIAKRIGVGNMWHMEMSALLSQIGLMAIPEDIIKKHRRGIEMTKEEKKIYESHPQIGGDLLSNLPRLEGVAKIISNQLYDKDDSQDAPVESKILKAVTAFEHYIVQDYTQIEALHNIQKRSEEFDLIVIKALSEELTGGKEHYVMKSINFRQLRMGMILAEDIVDEDGYSLVAKNQEITDFNLMKLVHRAKVKKIQEPIYIKEKIG